MAAAQWHLGCWRQLWLCPFVLQVRGCVVVCRHAVIIGLVMRVSAQEAASSSETRRRLACVLTAYR